MPEENSYLKTYQHKDKTQKDQFQSNKKSQKKKLKPNSNIMCFDDSEAEPQIIIKSCEREMIKT
jgi:hypothetical protein